MNQACIKLINSSFKVAKTKRNFMQAMFIIIIVVTKLPREQTLRNYSPLEVIRIKMVATIGQGFSNFTAYTKEIAN